MQVTIDFTGAVPEMTGVSDVSIRLDEGATFGDLVRKLSELYPELKGVVFDDEGQGLSSKMMFRRNRRENIQPEALTTHLQDGDHIAILAVPAGG